VFAARCEWCQSEARRPRNLLFLDAFCFSPGAPDAVIASGEFELDVILNEVKDIRRRTPTPGSAVISASVRRTDFTTDHFSDNAQKELRSILVGNPSALGGGNLHVSWSSQFSDPFSWPRGPYGKWILRAEVKRSSVAEFAQRAGRRRGFHRRKVSKTPPMDHFDRVGAFAGSGVDFDVR
jgi:hypothetical protein